MMIILLKPVFICASVMTWLGSGSVIDVPQVLIGMLNVKPVVALPDCRYLDRGKRCSKYRVTVPHSNLMLMINLQLKEREREREN